jgi:hypothetical protein
MIKRSFIVLLIIAGVILIAKLNPISLPKSNPDNRLIKLNSDGEPINAWAGPWSCVYDKKTKLTWEVKSYKEDIYSRECSFSWYNGKVGTKRGGNCYTNSGKSDTSDLIKIANNEQLCGLKKWRLPTKYELQTLFINNPKPGDPYLSVAYFPYTAKAAYWTSDINKKLHGHFSYLGNGAESVNFKDASNATMPYRNAAFVRLVAKN